MGAGPAGPASRRYVTFSLTRQWDDIAELREKLADQPDLLEAFEDWAAATRDEFAARTGRTYSLARSE